MTPVFKQITMPNDPLAGDPKGRAGKLVGVLWGWVTAALCRP